MGKTSLNPLNLESVATRFRILGVPLRLEILNALAKLKPSTAKGVYIKSISISSTMSPGVQVDTRTVTV